MSIFSFFKRSDETHKTLAGKESLVEPPLAERFLPEIEEQVFIAPGFGNDTTLQPRLTQISSTLNKMQTPVNIIGDNNIALLYSFLDRNYEIKGYDDALINPDSSHLDQNLSALKNDLVRTLSKVKTFYKDFLQETDFHIFSRARSGMVDMVEELEMKKKIALSHMETVMAIEEDTQKDDGDCKGILISYSQGFKNGLAAISHHYILSKKL